MDQRPDAIGRVKAQLSAGLAQLRSLLRRGQHGHVQDLSSLEHLLRRGEHAAILVDGGAELVLQVADAAIDWCVNDGVSSLAAVGQEEMGTYNRAGFTVGRRVSDAAAVIGKQTYLYGGLEQPWRNYR